MRLTAERQAVEFGVEIGEYRGVIRVPRRGFQRLLSSAAHPPSGASRRTISTDPVREHRRAEAAPAAVDRGRKCRDLRAGFALSRRWETVPPAGGASQIDP